jgi:hypothetical protein
MVKPQSQTTQGRKNKQRKFHRILLNISKKRSSTSPPAYNRKTNTQEELTPYPNQVASCINDPMCDRFHQQKTTQKILTEPPSFSPTTLPHPTRHSSHQFLIHTYQTVISSTTDPPNTFLHPSLTHNPSLRNSLPRPSCRRSPRQ